MNTKTAQETKDFGKKLATELQGGEILCLFGDLGAGKTTLVKGIAEGMGIKNDITSPTFTLMNVYKGNKNILAHIDTYRLKDEQELVEIGAEDYLGRPNVIAVVEWPEKIAGLLAGKKVKNIFIEHSGENSRKIKVK